MLRRESLKYLASGTLILISGLLKPITALAKPNKEAFSASDFESALHTYFPGQEITESDQITIGVHPVIENGAVVPLKINSDLPDIESITIFVDKNPNPLIANFDLSPVCKGFISTRIKVQNPSNIYAVVKSNDKVFMTKTFIEVHEGGCG